jgi:hypothetical protein
MRFLTDSIFLYCQECFGTLNTFVLAKSDQPHNSFGMIKKTWRRQMGYSEAVCRRTNNIMANTGQRNKHK